MKQNPDSGIARRYRRLGISVRQGQKLKSRLAEQLLITDSLKAIKTGSIQTIRLTEKGERFLNASHQSQVGLIASN